MYYFESFDRVCEISFEDILNLNNENKKHFFLTPSKKMSQNNYDDLLERICILKPKEELEIFLDNTILFLILGKVEIKNLKDNFILENGKNISVGPFKKKKIKIFNCKDTISIIHLTNERAIKI